MNLPIHNTAQLKNVLPSDGVVYYYGKIFSTVKSDQYFNELLKNIEWEHDQAILLGKHIVTKRKVAWYADKDFQYTYSHVTKQAITWTKQLMELKDIIELEVGEVFNACLLNLYHTGSEGMAWHSDGEKDLKKNGTIASVSFGAERKFSFKHKKTGEKIELILEHGSLLVMKDMTQTYWLHRLPPTKKINEPRINLTFRMMVS